MQDTYDPMTAAAVGHAICTLVPNVETIIFKGHSPLNPVFLQSFISLRRLRRLEFIGMHGSEWDDIISITCQNTELCALCVRANADIDLSALSRCTLLRDLCVVTRYTVGNLMGVLNACPIEHLEVSSMGELTMADVKSDSLITVVCHELSVHDDMSSFLQRFPFLRSITITCLRLSIRSIRHVDEFCRSIAYFPIFPSNGTLVLSGYRPNHIVVLRALKNSILSNNTHELNVKDYFVANWNEGLNNLRTHFPFAYIMIHLSETCVVIEEPLT